MDADVKWKVGRKEKEGSPARKSPQGKTSPSHRTPVGVKLERIEKKVKKVQKVKMKASTPQRKRKLTKEPDQDPKQRNIKEFLLRKSQPRAETPTTFQETGSGKTITRGPLVVPCWVSLTAGPPNQHQAEVLAHQLRYVGGWGQ